MKSPKSEPFLTQLDPSHPNHDAILLRRARLEAHRRRRMENSGLIRLQEQPKPAGKAGKKTRPAGKARPRKD